MWALQIAMPGFPESDAHAAPMMPVAENEIKFHIAFTIRLTAQCPHSSTRQKKCLTPQRRTETNRKRRFEQYPVSLVQERKRARTCAQKGSQPKNLRHAAESSPPPVQNKISSCLPGSSVHQKCNVAMKPGKSSPKRVCPRLLHNQPLCLKKAKRAAAARIQSK